MSLQTDFFVPPHISKLRYLKRNRIFNPITDRVLDLWLKISGASAKMEKGAAQIPVQRILLAAVEVPARKADLEEVIRQLAMTRHEVTVAIAPLGNKGKFQNISAAIKDYDLSRFDWLIVVDDDVALPAGFMDNFLYLAIKGGLKICQPAHKFQSYCSFDVSFRKLGVMARTTNFVECGPITAFHRDSFHFVLPFQDELRWAWGIDIYWAEMALRENMPIGMIDATPLRHLRPVGKTYDRDKAAEEAINFLNSHNIVRNYSEYLQTVKVLPVLD